MDQHPWNWARGKVNRSKEYLELRYGSVDKLKTEEWVPVAIVGSPEGNTFPVEYLLSGEDPKHREMIKAVEEELDFNLVKKGESNPWAYLQYHCTTSSNLYSEVHWVSIDKISS